MALPAGIDSFAQGLIRGMEQKKADARQAEQDAMRKQEFDLQQQARTLDIENARTTAANSKMDRERALRLQARGDTFNNHFNNAYALLASGDNDGAIVTLANGFNDPAFGMPYKAVPQTGPDGKLVKDSNGKYAVNYVDQSGKVALTQAWTPQEALQGFRGINDAASQFDKAMERQAKAEEKADDHNLKLEEIDRAGEWDVKKARTTSEAALDRALESIRLRGELGAYDGRGGAKSKYDLGETVSALIKDSTGASPLTVRMIVDGVSRGMDLATRGKDAASRADGWSTAFNSLRDTVRHADSNKKLTPAQIEEQTRSLFDEYLRETYGVGYDDAMQKIGIVRASSLPKPASPNSVKAPAKPSDPAKTLIDPIKKADQQKAYQRANNFITGGGF